MRAPTRARSAGSDTIGRDSMRSDASTATSSGQPLAEGEMSNGAGAQRAVQARQFPVRPAVPEYISTPSGRPNRSPTQSCRSSHSP